MTEETPPFRLVPRAVYTAKRALLDDQQLPLVEAAEREIARDPEHDDDRWPSARGGRIDYSPSESGVMVEFALDERPDHDSEVELIDLIDVATASQGRRWPIDEG